MIAALRRFRPIDGWRRFWGEVGIIVLGVLIALVIGQAAQAWQDARNSADARDSIDEEVADNLGLIARRMQLQPCIDRRLREVETVLTDALAGRPERIRVGWIGRPPYWIMTRTRFDAASQAGRASLLTLNEQTTYTDAYASIAAFADAQRLEQAAWARLRALEIIGPPKSLLAGELLLALQDARMANWAISTNGTQALEAKPAGLKLRPRGGPGTQSACLPIATPRAEAVGRLASPYGDP